MKTKILKWVIGITASFLVLIGGLFLIPMYYILKTHNPKNILITGIGSVVIGGVILIALKFYNMTKYTETIHHNHYKRKHF